MECDLTIVSMQPYKRILGLLLILNLRGSVMRTSDSWKHTRALPAHLFLYDNSVDTE